MKTDGLVSARNLGQVVSGHAATSATVATPSAATPAAATRGRAAPASTSSRLRGMSSRTRFAGNFRSSRGFARASMGGGFRPVATSRFGGGFAHSAMGGGFGGGVAHPMGGGFAGGGFGGGMGGGGFGHG